MGNYIFDTRTLLRELHDDADATVHRDLADRIDPAPHRTTGRLDGLFPPGLTLRTAGAVRLPVK
jgi:hypothetical protein